MFPDITLLQEAVEFVARLEAQEGASLIGGEGAGPVAFNSQSFQSFTRRVGMLCQVVGQFENDLHGLKLAESRCECHRNQLQSVRCKSLVHLAGFGFEVFFEGDFEVEELFSVGVFDGVYVEQRALKRMAEAADVVEKEAGAGGVGLDDQSLEFEGIEVLLDGLVGGFAFAVDGDRSDGDLSALFFLARHKALDVFRVGGLDAILELGDEEDARVAEGNGAVAVIGDDEADGQYAVGEVVDAEEGHLLFSVVGLGGDGQLFVSVNFDGGEVGGGLNGGRGVGLDAVCGAADGRGSPQYCREYGHGQQKRLSAQSAHSARLYHFRG